MTPKFNAVIKCYNIGSRIITPRCRTCSGPRRMRGVAEFQFLLTPIAIFKSCGK
jgi:hypothetical protein